MHIELRDPLGKVHRIAAGGATLGRDPRRCDIVIADRSISGVHAKVYSRDGSWFLEDLQSSNGTYVAEKRIASPVPLQVGTEFLLFRWGFEVTHVDRDAGGEAVDSASQATSDVDSVAPLPPEIDTAKTAPLIASRRVAPAGSRGAAPRAVATGSWQQTPAAAPDTGSSSVARDADTEPPEDEERSATSEIAVASGGFLASAHAALIHYVRTLPRLIARPVRQVRAEIAQQEEPPLGGVELSAWTFSSLLLGAFFDFAGRVLAAALSGTVTLRLLLVLPLMLVVAAAVAGLVMAFTWHPILDWFVRALGGRSDEHSRSNMAVAVLSTLPLVFLASGLGQLLLVVPLPFVAMVPPLLSLAAILLVLFVHAAWFRYFEAVGWFSYVWIGLGALAILSASWTEVWAVRAGLAQLVASRSVAAVPAAGSNPADPSTSTAALPSTAGEASTTARGTTDGGPVPVPPNAVSNAGLEAGRGGEGPPTPPAPTTIVLHPEPIEPPSVAPAAKAAQPDGGTSATGVAAVGRASSLAASSYAEYLRKRAAIERAIETDPPLLTRVPGVLALYRKLHSETDRIQEKYARPKRGASEVDVVTERLRDAEIYDATVELVSELDRLLRVGP